MTADEGDGGNAASIRRPGVLARLRRLARSRDGATAIEFALLAIPYFVIVFAIIETFIAFTAEQLVTNAVDTLGRQLRTGQITANHNTSTDKDEQAFRQLFCNEIAILMTCSATEIATPNKLWLDVESYSSFASIPTGIPRKSASDPYSEIDTSGFKYAPGGPSTINVLRAYYRWQIMTDIIRPYITTIHPADNSMPTVFLIVATAAYQNEKYP